ncbi:MAG TPA: hypothetical protein VHD33_04510 [Legionellaceae bacterium]|nr:hypothetical protein [Legionellaceae bacterium]
MVAIFFPAIIIFADDNPLGAILALILQASVIGWIPAMLWAWGIVHRPPPPTPQETITPEQNTHTSTVKND